VRIDLGKALRSDKKIAALATIGGPRNQSFLTTVWSNIDDVATIPFELLSAYVWIAIHLHLISPEQTDPDLKSKLAKDPQLLDFASQFLKSSSTGIDHLALSRTLLTEEEFVALIPYGKTLNFSVIAEDSSWEYELPNGDLAMVERRDGLRYSRLRLEAAHKTNSGEVAPLDLQDESDGTRRLLELLPALHGLRQGGQVYFIDEVDQSLHPMLVRSFLEYFLNSCEGDHRQLIMTTHESSLLDQELLRRDEIWFAEKDAAGATSLYSLLDFKVRNDLEIRKHYLQGRFGAVPFLGGVQRLMEEEGQPA
jgi:uncharacterized protein